MKRSISFFLVFILCLFTLSAFTSCGKPKDYLFELTFHDGFKIMQLADIQAKNTKKMDKAFQEIDGLVEREKPNLIILTGDNLGVAKKSKVLPSLIKHMEKYKIPWAPVFGNHDGEGDISKDEIAKAFISAKHCIFYKGEKGVDGVGNYVINLVDKSDKIAYSLFLIDSNMYDANDRKEEYVGADGKKKMKRSYDCIHENQIAWYERAVGRIESMNGGDPVPSLAFFHIPLFEFEEARVGHTKKGSYRGSASSAKSVLCRAEIRAFSKRRKNSVAPRLSSAGMTTPTAAAYSIRISISFPD